MPLPPLDSPPSETTIAEVTNRRLLERLNDPTAWALSPSNIEEKDLGYDASFQRVKLGVIQYKKAIRYESGTVSATVNVEQHEALRRAYPAPGFVFYAFGDFTSYRDVDEAHQTGTVLRRMHFVDASSFKVGTTTLSRNASGKLAAYKERRPTPVSYVTGETWAELFIECQVGRVGREIDRQALDEMGGSFGNIRYLISRYWGP